MRLLSRLDGPAPAWPRPLDAALEWWATLPVRARVALRAATTVVVAMAVAGGVTEGPWGPPVEVVVVRRDVPAGAPVGVADLEVTGRPAGLVPHDALTDLAAVAPDAVADGRLLTGSVVTARSVRAGGPAGAAVAGTAVVPVPTELLPALPLGTRVDLAVAGIGGEARIVARDATVVGDDGTWRWVRVERDAVAQVAGGVSDATLVTAVLPPPRGAEP